MQANVVITIRSSLHWQVAEFRAMLPTKSDADRFASWVDRDGSNAVARPLLQADGLLCGVAVSAGEVSAVNRCQDGAGQSSAPRRMLRSSLT